MKGLYTILAIALILTSFASAGTTIIFNEQPEEIYNLGDKIEIPVTIKSTSDTYGMFEMNLLCSGAEIDFYKNGVSLAAGEETQMETSLILMKDLISSSKGTCKIKAVLGEDYELSEEFEISDSITVTLDEEYSELQPGQEVVFSGQATKANGEFSSGFAEINLIYSNTTAKIYEGTIKNGAFSINIDLEDDLKAGGYLLKVIAYEQNSKGETTNQGYLNKNIRIKQIPSALEVAFESEEVEPGTDAKIKAILRDQTGEKVLNTTARIIIKNKDDKILEQEEIQVDEYFSYPILYNEAPTELKVEATALELEGKATFEILEKENIEVEIANETLYIRNKGNIEYCNKTVLVKIGEESLNIETCLEVDGEQKYQLTAPDGEYAVEIISDQGTELSTSVLLTGKAIDIKKSRSKIGNIKYYTAWVFIIAILGFMVFIIFKKGHTKKFFSYLPSKKHKPSSKAAQKFVPLKKKSLITSKNKAELSLSIKGQKQNVNVVCLKIKNLGQLENVKSNAEEVLQKIVDIAENEKAATYENRNDIFFILSATKTKTFKNEKIALELSQKIKSILDDYNRLAKHKIEYGIGINYGTMVVKNEPNGLKFMSMGTLITTAKKIADFRKEEIVLSEKVEAKTKEEIKTEKHTQNETNYYTIKEFKDSEQNKKFLRSFLSRLEK